jgi:hypothetical protein
MELILCTYAPICDLLCRYLWSIMRKFVIYCIFIVVWCKYVVVMPLLLALMHIYCYFILCAGIHVNLIKKRKKSWAFAKEPNVLCRVQGATRRQPVRLGGFLATSKQALSWAMRLVHGKTFPHDTLPYGGKRSRPRQRTAHGLLPSGAPSRAHGTGSAHGEGIAHGKWKLHGKIRAHDKGEAHDKLPSGLAALRTAKKQPTTNCNPGPRLVSVAGRAAWAAFLCRISDSSTRQTLCRASSSLRTTRVLCRGVQCRVVCAVRERTANLLPCAYGLLLCVAGTRHRKNFR